MNKEQPMYWALIPANVRYSQKITANAKLLYGEITSLSQISGKCWASNKYFAELYKVKKRQIIRWINSLEKNGFIKYEKKDKIRIIIPLYDKNSSLKD